MSDVSFIHRVARAVENQFDDQFVELLDPYGPLSSYGLSHAIARAVLTAMREPSETMEREGWKKYGNGPCVVPIWQAMVDAALSEGG